MRKQGLMLIVIASIFALLAGSAMPYAVSVPEIGAAGCVEESGTCGTPVKNECVYPVYPDCRAECAGLPSYPTYEFEACLDKCNAVFGDKAAEYNKCIENKGGGRIIDTGNTASSSGGDVKMIAPDGTSTPLMPGIGIPDGATIETGANGRAEFIANDGSTISMEPGSQIAMGRDSVKFSQGKIRFKTPLRLPAKTPFNYRAGPALVAPTNFPSDTQISYDPITGNFDINQYAGGAGITIGNNPPVTINAGQTANVNSGGGIRWGGGGDGGKTDGKCKTDADCKDSYKCKTLTGECVQCLGMGDCIRYKPNIYCSYDSMCVACTEDSHCPGNYACRGNQCAYAGGNVKPGLPKAIILLLAVALMLMVVICILAVVSLFVEAAARYSKSRGRQATAVGTFSHFLGVLGVILPLSPFLCIPFSCSALLWARDQRTRYGETESSEKAEGLGYVGLALNLFILLMLMIFLK